jgi:hypothetical protein
LVAFVYDSAEKQMLNAISLVIEQQKNEFDSMAKVFRHLFLCLARECYQIVIFYWYDDEFVNTVDSHCLEFG